MVKGERLNTFKTLPVTAKKEDYPSDEAIEEALNPYDVTKIDAAATARETGDRGARTANVVMLGLLSTIEPFNLIPRETWLSALMSISPTDFIKAANQASFKAGRELNTG